MGIKELIDGKIEDIRDIVDTRFNELVHRIEYRAEVTQTAVKEAKADLNARLASMNEFREAMKDLTSSFVNRSEIEAVKDQIKHHITRAEHDTLVTRIAEIDKKIEKCATLEDVKRIDSRMDGIKNWQIGLLVGLVMALVGLVIDMSGVRI